MTRLNNSELVLGKLFASLLEVYTMLFAALPLFVAITLFGGVSLEQVWRVFGVTAITMLVAAVWENGGAVERKNVPNAGDYHARAGSVDQRGRRIAATRAGRWLETAELVRWTILASSLQAAAEATTLAVNFQSWLHDRVFVFMASNALFSPGAVAHCHRTRAGLESFAGSAHKCRRHRNKRAFGNKQQPMQAMPRWAAMRQRELAEAARAGTCRCIVNERSFVKVAKCGTIPFCGEKCVRGVWQEKCSSFALPTCC